MQEAQVRSLSQEDPLEKEMANHSSVLAWEIPWTEEPDGLQSMGSQRVGWDLAHARAHTHTHTHTHREREIEKAEIHTQRERVWTFYLMK